MLEKIERYLILIVAFLSPVFFLPIFSESYVFPKLIALVSGVVLLIVIRAIRVISEKKFDFYSGSFDFPLLILALGYALSSFFTKTNPVDAFVMPGTTSLILGALFLYFFANTLNLSQRTMLKFSLFLSGLVVSLISLFSFAGLLSKIPQLTSILDRGKLNILGGELPTIVFTLGVIPLGISLILSTKDFAKKFFYIVSSVIIVIGLCISLAGTMAKDNPIQLADFQTSWVVAVDSLKESPIFGSGSGNYLSSFNRFKPLSYNSSDAWQLRFTTARNYYLTVVTETGIIGLVSLLALVIAFANSAKRVKFDFQFLKEGSFASLLIVLVFFLLFPATISGIILLFLLLSLNSTTKRHEFAFSHKPKYVTYGLAVPAILAVVALSYFMTRVVMAEYKFKTALTSLAAGDGKKTYDLMREVISLNQYSDRYHAVYAQTNIAIAQSLAQQKDISDDDKKTISVLIQQAIREGKATVFLNQKKSGNWEMLARIYQAIIPFAKGADEFTIQAYSQAIALDPINPNLRIALGGVLYSLQKYDEAIDVFKLAAAAKPDLANAHYNLSAAYREKEDYTKAIAEMEIVITLVEKDSADYTQAQKELGELTEKKPKSKEPAETETLTTPEKTEQAITPPLDLPSEATPPASTQ